MERIVQNTDQLKTVAKELLERIGTSKKMVLTGEIGAGKTTFVQAICAHLNAEGPITSPTFSLVNEYPLINGPGAVYHIDLYRLNTIEEALDIGIEDYLYDENYCFIEWPELIEPLLPEDIVHINITIVENSARKLLILLQ